MKTLQHVDGHFVRVTNARAEAMTKTVYWRYVSKKDENNQKRETK